MDLIVCCWSEVDNGVTVKYFTSITFGHAKAQNVVTEILKTLREISHSSQTDAFSWDGWTKCEQVYTEQIKSDKKGERLLTASLLHTKFSDSCFPQ